MEAVTRGHYSSLPISMPSKAPTGANYFPVSRVAGSPPEVSDASTTTGSATGDFDSSLSYPSVDVIEMLSDRMANVFDPSRLDKGVAKQAQLSGKLNDKQRELLELQALAKRRIKNARANFADGIKAAKETKNDLEWAHKRVSAMKIKAERNHPDEYRRATNRYTYDDY
jgi:biogenesis of lysosome-related organelles complex 1 subunit KXD1